MIRISTISYCVQRQGLQGKACKLTLNRGYEYREQVDARANGLTVLAYLSEKYRHSSEVEWRERLERGEVSLDGRRALPATVLVPGRLLVWNRPPWDEPEVPLCFALLHLDDELLAVAKPRGLPCVPAGGFLEHTLLALVRRLHPEATPVHRLGRGTSGVVLFARTARARSALNQSLRSRSAIKVYRALCGGSPQHDEFSIEAPIGPVAHPRLGTVHAASPSGRQASSRVRVLERRPGATLVEVRIETGRPHQIRIHLASAGHPLVGDPLYLPGGDIGDVGAALPGDPGYLLHAERISLGHPATGSPLEVWCCPPSELRMAGEYPPDADDFRSPGRERDNCSKTTGTEGCGFSWR